MEVSYIMDVTRWKKDEKEFVVSLTDDYSGSIICRVPKPILKFLNNPSYIRFVIEGKKITVKEGIK